MELNGTIIIQVAIFLITLLWLSRSLFSPIVRLFEEREKRIDGAKKEAADLNYLAEKKALDFDVQYETARDNARKSLSQLKQELEKKQSSALESAKVQARKKVEVANAQLLEQEDQIRSNLPDVNESVAADIINAVMRRGT